MNQTIVDPATVEQLIRRGEKLILAGDEKVLAKLPPGNWIGGSIPYFMTNDEGGVFSRDRIHVTEMPDYVTDVVAKTYDVDTISQIYTDAPANGLSFIILPAFSDIHISFALNSPTYEGFATSPLIGWISGVALDDPDGITPKTFDGTAAAHEKKAVVFHIELPPDKAADIRIINIFQQGRGDTIIFPADGFHTEKAIINGKEADFVTYIEQNNIDTKLPLVADMYGAMMNISIKQVDSAKNQVDFYAPVFAGIEYKIAHPVEDYVSNFEAMMPGDLGDNIFFSCNCILNYVHADLQNKTLHGFTGPMTFGEIAYHLLNQTLAYVAIEEIEHG